MLDIYIYIYRTYFLIRIDLYIHIFKNWLVKMANTMKVCILKDLYKDASKNKDQNLCP